MAKFVVTTEEGRAVSHGDVLAVFDGDDAALAAAKYQAQRKLTSRLALSRVVAIGPRDEDHNTVAVGDRITTTEMRGTHGRWWRTCAHLGDPPTCPADREEFSRNVEGILARLTKT